ncbi:MAG: hypothetical protein QXF26_06445 [Candidatus Bathyarchaeia archaeon]
MAAGIVLKKAFVFIALCFFFASAVIWIYLFSIFLLNPNVIIPVSEPNPLIAFIELMSAIIGFLGSVYFAVREVEDWNE